MEAQIFDNKRDLMDTINQQQFESAIASIWNFVDNKEKDRKKRDRGGSKDSEQLDFFDSLKTSKTEQTPIATEDEFSQHLSKDTPIESTLEDVNNTYEDKSHLKPSQPLESPKSEESSEETQIEGVQEDAIATDETSSTLPDVVGHTKMAKHYGIAHKTLAQWRDGKVSPKSEEKKRIYREITNFFDWDKESNLWRRKHT